MNGYGQFCPIAKASEVLGERWTNLVIRELAAGSHTFNDIRKGLPLMSPTLLSARLKSLERAGVIIREKQDSHVRYYLSEAGDELASIIWQLGTWGQRWVRSDLSDEDLDPSMLVWDIHRTINTEYFDALRTVIQFEFTDYTSRFRLWWLVIKEDDVDVCMKDQGFETDLLISTDVRTLTAIWIGDLSLSRALKERTVVLKGSTYLRRSINHWLGRNYYANVKSARKNG